MKTNDAEATLRQGNLPKAEAVETTAKAEEGAAKKCAAQQVGNNIRRSGVSEDGCE